MAGNLTQAARGSAPKTPTTTSHLIELAGRETIRERVTHGIRAAIISGELAPGTVYSAPALAALFGVSPTPVREAMIDLASEGLVTSQRNKGYLVTEVSEDDLDQMTELRRLLEPAGMRMAVPHVPESEFPALRELAQTVLDASASGDLIAYVDVDREFHMRMLSFCGNQRLIDIVADLRAKTRLYGLPTLAERHALAVTAEEHMQLVDLFEQRRADDVERLMHKHLDHVRGLWAGHGDA